ncbi:uncharacterized protein K02A2.6-like [Ruditapes philippinarum]|uniref:uncharacterized protein K02A2.6-like n=1 Tax=Ruditapes philippinarum TaxID=129788 RepID=UPI00295B19D9|nr:uncharacterized protein K02A2.6-like [Ruditapes philippinarum]
MTCQSDHKPLQAIWKKGLNSAPPRLQRILLHLQPYDIDVVFIPGKDIPLADCLSRKFLPDTCPEIAESANLETHVHTIMSNLPVSDQKMEQIRLTTKSDLQMKILSSVIHEGWPNNRTDCPQSILEFWNFRDELSVIDGVILNNTKILVPAELRSLMLDIIHDAHLGVEKCLNRTRNVLFWPNMATDIKKKVLECPICIEHRCSNPKEPLRPNKIPDRPWQICATDLFHWNNSDYVLLVDAYSKYFEVSQISSTKSSTVINKLKSFFSRHGIPEVLFSDNGPCYSAESFLQFTKLYDFSHVTSSPGHSSGNGLAEITVKTVKNLFTKSKQAGKDPYLAMLEYRNAPLPCGKSPAQLLMSRQLRSTLPLMSEQLDPKVPDTQVIRDSMFNAKQRSKYYNDRSTKTLKPLEIGEGVRIRQGKSWLPAEVMHKVHDRSYDVRTKDGAIYRRNRYHLLKSNEQPFSETENSSNNSLHEPPLEIKSYNTKVHNPSTYDPANKILTPGQDANSQKSPVVLQSQTPKQTSPVKHQSPLSENADNEYKTRSGRCVKKPHKLTM